jgi:hypothetical protein
VTARGSRGYSAAATLAVAWGGRIWRGTLLERGYVGATEPLGWPEVTERGWRSAERHFGALSAWSPWAPHVQAAHELSHLVQHLYHCSNRQDRSLDRPGGVWRGRGGPEQFLDRILDGVFWRTGWRRGAGSLSQWNGVGRTRCW